MSAVPQLERLYDLLQDSERWTQGCLARNKEGVSCPTTSPTAVRFSLLGALDYLDSLSSSFDIDAPGADITGMLAEILAKRLGHSLPTGKLRYSTKVNLLDAFSDLASHVSVVGLIEEACILAK